MKTAFVFTASSLAAGILLAAAIPSLPACSSSSSPPPSGGAFSSTVPWAGPDVNPPSDVTLQPDVVIVHGGASAVKAYSSDHGVWTLDKNASGVSSLVVGSVLLIAGLDCARVTAIQDNGGTLDVTVVPVSITDVIQEGSFQWQNQAIDMTHAYVGQVPYGVVIAADATDAGTDAGGDCGASDAGVPEAGASDAGEGGVAACMDLGPRLHAESNPSTQVTVNIGHWSVSFSATTSTGVDISVSATWTPGSPNAALPGDKSQTLGVIGTGVTINGHVNSIQGTSGSATVHGGSITGASLSAPLEGSVDLSADVNTPHGSQFPAQALLKIPLAIEFPLPAIIPGVPFYVSVQVNLAIQPSLATANSVLGIKSHIAFSGNAGGTFSAGSASPTATPMATTPDNPINGATAPPAIGTMAVIFAAQAPRIGFGIGTMAFGVGAKAGIYVDAVNSLTLTVAGATAPFPCEAATWNFVPHFGGEMAIVIGSTMVGVNHQISLVPATATWNSSSWYTPMINACKP
jgi:hypothetical protein